MTTVEFAIADSGGSGTGWAFYHTDGTVSYRRTESLHPRFALADRNRIRENLLREFGTSTGIPLIFYGAGCSDVGIALEMQQLLSEAGFSVQEVLPDTLGACRAVCGDAPGMVAILGTGSVLLAYDGTAIVERYGGWGSLLGDEGSGFYFGKLLLRAYLSGNLSEAAAFFGSPAVVSGKLASPDATAYIASLAGAALPFPTGKFHRENLECFVKNYLPDRSLFGNRLSGTGSYGFHQLAVLKELADLRGWHIGNWSADPLEELVMFHRNKG